MLRQVIVAVIHLFWQREGILLLESQPSFLKKLKLFSVL